MRKVLAMIGCNDSSEPSMYMHVLSRAYMQINRYIVMFSGV